MKNHYYSASVLFGLALLLFVTTPAMAQGGPVRGAIFTTLHDGSAVNANQFESKCAVYLDGGPGPNAPARAAGLPDGEYYFQVTDPSGKVLLSTDAVSNRKFKVTGGVITAYTGSGGLAHPTDIDRDHSGLGAITIGLANTSCPEDFLDTPNNGGAYKVWATPTVDFLGDPTKVDNPCVNGCFHGFLPSKSKTDNFKVRTGSVTFCLTVQKQLKKLGGDFITVAGWQIDLTDQLSVTNSYHTNDQGTPLVCGLSPGSYTVVEVAPDDPVYDYTVSELIVNGKSVPPASGYFIDWAVGQPAPVIVFKNLQVYKPQ